jgi:acetylornithine deacetylase
MTKEKRVSLVFFAMAAVLASSAMSATTVEMSHVDFLQGPQDQQAMFENIESNRSRHLEFLKSLIAASANGEEAVQARVAERFSEIGADVRTLRLLPTQLDLNQEFAADETIDRVERISVVGILEGSGEGRSLLFFGHPDGEPQTEASLAGWTRDPFAAEVENGRIYGWGVADDLAGVAIMAEALDAVLTTMGRPAGDIYLGSTPAKRNARGILALLNEGYHADASVYLHPAESEAGLNDIKAITSGMLQFRVTVLGRPPDTREPGQTAFAHVSISAVDKASVVLEALKQLDRERAGRVFHETLNEAVGRSTNLLVSNMTCGEEGSFTQVPTECVIGVSITFPPNEQLDAVQEEITTALSRAAQGDPWLVENPPNIEWLFGTQGVEVPSEHPLYQTVHDAVLLVTGVAPVINPLHSASDIRNPMLFRGIPSVGLGPLAGDFTQAGRFDEWVDADDYIRAIQVCAKVIADWAF